MSKELPSGDEILMAHLEEQSRRDIAGIEQEIHENRDIAYPDWKELAPKVRVLRNLARVA